MMQEYVNTSEAVWHGMNRKWVCENASPIQVVTRHCFLCLESTIIAFSSANSLLDTLIPFALFLLVQLEPVLKHLHLPFDLRVLASQYDSSAQYHPSAPTHAPDLNGDKANYS